MTRDRTSLSPVEAARRLGVSPKALRLYEAHGLLAPGRTASGYRAYDAADLERAQTVVGLRHLGLSLAQVRQVLGGDPQGLAGALKAQEGRLVAEAEQTALRLARVRALRAELAGGGALPAERLADLDERAGEPIAAFPLPWPWGGEPFELRALARLNYIIGPLGSGKTRFARALAEALPDAAFLDLERTADMAAVRARLDEDPALRRRVDASLAWLSEDGAILGDALLALVVALQAEGPAILVVDMVEEGLDAATQAAVAAWLARGPTPTLFMLTRSSAILDLEAVPRDAAIYLCPANHSPPVRVAPVPGAAGYESVATCLATPEVRARTAGLTVVRAAAG